MRKLVLIATVAIAAATGCSSATVQDSPAPPTAFVSPTPKSTDLIDARTLELYGATRLRDFPAKLENSSQILSPNEVEAIWTEFIADSVVFAGTDTIIQYCSDGNGEWQTGVEQTGYEGAVFTWSIQHSPGDPWNQPRLNMNLDPETLAPGIVGLQGANIKGGLRPPDSSGILEWPGIGGSIGTALTRGNRISVFDTTLCSR